MSSLFKKIPSAIFISIIFTTITFFTQILYTSGDLGGSFNKYMLPTERFGIPNFLAEKGIQSFTKDFLNTGWDGQFYYYISNDLFNSKNISKNLDSPAYRFQRVGLPLTANLVAKVFFQEWVSPLTYYFTNFIMVLVALILLSKFLKEQRLNPYLSLIWALGAGTQLTLSRGLPDSFADACLIIGIIFYLNKKISRSTIFFILASLSREIYLVIPIILWVHQIFVFVKNKQFFDFIIRQKIHYYLLAPIFYVLWMLYIRIEFGHFPSQDAVQGGILDTVPFRAWYKMLISSYSGTHPNHDLHEWKLLSSYMILIISTFFLIAKILLDFKNWKDAYYSIALSFAPIIMLYSFFGTTVMAHFSGYFKSATIFFFLSIILIKSLNVRTQKFILVILLMAFWLPFKTQISMAKTFPGTSFNDYSKYWSNEHIVSSQACINADLQFSLKDVKNFDNATELNSLLRRSPIKLIELEVLSERPLTLLKADGIGRAYFQVLGMDRNNEIISASPESAIQNKLVNLNKFKLSLPIVYKKEIVHLSIRYGQNKCSNEFIRNIN